MPTATRTFRVFVSSTFEDLKEERNALQREVFPKLAKLCEEHGARFQAIDLRWGVRDEADLDQKTMAICLAEIERCKKTNLKPNFIVLLGDRYGWRPLPARIEAGEFERVGKAIGDGGERTLVDNWYQRDDNAVPPEFLLKPRTGEFTQAHRWGEVEGVLRGVLREAARNAGVDPDGLIKYEASATHQEILKGLGGEPEDREHVFAFLRNATNGQDPDLENLKETLKQQLGGSVFSFEAGDYDELCRRVRESLEGVILQEIARFESRSALDLEIEAQNNFAADRSRHFVGRAAVMSAINDYVRGDDQRPLVIHGASGSGKSAIMAKASDAVGAVRRYIGATPESSNGLTLLRSLCQEIAGRYGQPEDAPATFNELVVAFADRLKLATRERPLLLFLDALDQLVPQDPAAAANWLPAQLPPHCRVVVSTIEVPAALQQAGLLVVEPFSPEEGDQALALWFDEVQRTPQKEQREKLLASFRRSPLPLYLKLAFEEARCWKSFTPIEHCVLGEGLAEIIDRLFSRLSEESNHGPVLVSRALGYLTAARYGLADDEILAVLSNDDEVWEDFRSRAKHAPPERRLPVIVWSRLYLDLEPYLTERAAPGGEVISFYHRQLVEQIPTSSAHHSALASYFVRRSLWLGPQRSNERTLTEMVRQQVKAELLDEAVASLTQIEYLEAKCAADLVSDLQDDYRYAISALPEGQVESQIEHRRRELSATWGKSLAEYSRHCREGLGGPHFPEAAIACPSPVPSVCPQTENTSAIEHQRTIDHPSRRDRLRAFQTFVEHEAYSLSQFARMPDFVVQHAWNHAPQGPVHDAAATRINAANSKVLVRRWHHSDPYVSRPACLRTCWGHTSGVEAVAILPDYSRVASGSHDNTVRLWNLDTGECLRVFHGHTSPVTAVSFTDNRRLLSSSEDGTLRLWDTASGCCISTLTSHSYGKLAIDIAGSYVVSGKFTDEVKLWTLEPQVCIRTMSLTTHKERRVVDFLAITVDGRYVLIVSNTTVTVWDAEADRCLRDLVGHTDRVWSIALTPDGQHAATASHDRTVKVWNIRDGICLGTLKGHSRGVTSVAISADGRVLMSGSQDHSLKVWDVGKKLCLRTFTGHSQQVRAVSITPDARRAASGSSDGTLKVWDVETGADIPQRERHAGPVKSVAVTRDGRRAISTSGFSSVKLWSVDTGECVWTSARETPVILSGHGASWRMLAENAGETQFIHSVAIDSTGERAVLVDPNGLISVFDVAKTKCVRSFDASSGYIAHLLGCLLQPWVDKGKAGCHVGKITALAMGPNGRRAATGSADKRVKLWDLESGTCVQTFKGHDATVDCVGFTPSGDSVVSGARDGTVRCWDVRTGKCIRRFVGHDFYVTGIACIANGREVVTVSGHTLRVWDMESGTCLRRFDAPFGGERFHEKHLEGSPVFINSFSATADGRYAVIGGLGKDRLLRLVSLESGVCCAIESLHTHWRAAAFDLGARLLAVGTETGEVLVFEVDIVGYR